MPTCKVCDEHFPNRLMIDGKFRVLSSRTKCLTCLPFKAPRGKQGNEKSVCRECKREFKFRRGGAQSRSLCNSCVTKRRRNRVKTRAIEMFGGSCQICGYNRCPAALTFHHVDPSTKKFGIGNAYNRRWSIVEEELRKCVMLCHNCHDEVHYGTTKLTEASGAISSAPA